MRGDVGVGGCGVVWVWVWGGGCGCGHGESNSCTKLYLLRARLYHSSWFVQSVIFGQSLLNKLEGVGKCVWGSVCGCGAVGVVRWV